MIQRLLDLGFRRVLVLDASECGVEDAQRVLLAIWAYEAEKEPAQTGGWIHPYYRVSQKAYMAAAQVAREMAEKGVRHRDDVLLKPIMGRIPGMTRGRNTLSYLEGIGSRFHVQVLTTQDPLPITHHLLKEVQPLHCGDCRRCMEACPTGAIDEEGFHREKCLRNWMMSGKPVPVEIREKMGNRLIGCDECQRCCPHNPPPEGKAGETVPLNALLSATKATAEALWPVIGANLTIPNRVLSQACMIAGCSHDASLLPILHELAQHPSPTVKEHAAWAAEKLKDV